MEKWKEDAEKGWQLLSWGGQAQWFATKEGPPKEQYIGPTTEFPDTYGVRITPGKKRVMGGRLRGLDQLIGTIRNAEALGWNLYLNANPVNHGRSVRKAARGDIVAWRYVVVDLDPDVEALVPPNLPCGDPMASCVGPAMLLRHANCIFSGRGYQYWLPLEPPIGFGDFAEEYIERLMQGYLHALTETVDEWAPGWIVDTSCSDLARVVRCPGSVNQKTGKRSEVLELKQPGYGVAWHAFEQYEVPAYTAPAAPILKDSADLLTVLPHLNINARRFILEGVSSPGRHRACYATCKTLHELGVPAGRALEWLLIGAGKSYECAPHIRPKPLDIPEVQRIVERVYQVVAGGR